MMKVVGIALILGSIGFAFRWVTTHGNYVVAVVGVTGVAILAGIGILIQDRITELTLKGVGTIKAASAQAESDAKTITDIKEKMEHQSATVNLVANEATRARELSQQAAETTEEAKATLEELKSITDFMALIVAAQTDDRAAFDKLEEIANDKNNKFSSKALQAWITVLNAHAQPMYSTGLKFPWKKGIDPSKLSFNQLKQGFSEVPPASKLALLEYIWGRNDIPKYVRLEFLMEVMKTDSSLTVVEYAGRYFTAGTGQEMKPLAVSYISEWWEKHQQEFKEK